MRKANWAIDKVTGDMRGRFAFNTAIAAIMELVNDLLPLSERGSRRAPVCDGDRRVADLSVRAAPRLRGLRDADWATCWETPWPAADPAMLLATRSSWSARSTARFATGSQAPTGAAREELEQLALAAPGVQSHTAGTQIVKVIVVPGKLVNVVVR